MVFVSARVGGGVACVSWDDADGAPAAAETRGGMVSHNASVWPAMADG